MATNNKKKKRKKKRIAARTNKPGAMTPEQGNVAQERAAQKQAEQLNYVISMVLRAIAPRMNKLETTIANKIESDAVSFRLLFDHAGIDSEMRQSALREMHIVREMMSLSILIAEQFELETPEGILAEIANIPLRTDEHAIKKPITVVFVWARPGTLFEDDDWPATTLCAIPGDGVKFDPGAVTPDREEGELAFMFVDKGSFTMVAKGQSSTELEFMEHMVGIDMPATVGNFIYALDLDSYFAELKRAAMEKNRHPEGAKKFGGKP